MSFICSSSASGSSTSYLSSTAAISSTRSSESAARSLAKLLSSCTWSGSMPRISAASACSSLKSSWVAIAILLVGLGAFDHERGVVAAEPERVREGHLGVRLASLVGDVVQVALRVRVVQVDRRRQQTAVEREHARGGLEGAGGAQQVTVDGFGRADRELVGVVAEDGLDGFRLGHVAQLGRRSMGVDGAHVRQLDDTPL